MLLFQYKGDQSFTPLEGDKTYSHSFLVKDQESNLDFLISANYNSEKGFIEKTEGGAPDFKLVHL